MMTTRGAVYDRALSANEVTLKAGIPLQPMTSNAHRTIETIWRVPLGMPPPPELARRLSSVLEVVYLLFNGGYAATAGGDWMRPELCDEALRLGRMLAELAPAEPEVHGLVALMEIQASRMRARVGPSGEPVLLLDQSRTR